MNRQTHYPSYDVMNEKDEWDDHTQSIVTSRLIRKSDYQFLTLEETELLKRICSRLMDDDREEVISFVISHIDQTLSAGIGEGQRKVGIPKSQILIREGLRSLEETATKRYLFGFTQLNADQQKQLIREISEKKTAQGLEWEAIMPADFFKKLMDLTVESYCSHPLVWSEMGYGGPAYPRGYVRTQMGQLDPWEAQPENE
ncbi:MAG TPA: gluconate 2-dehydrogenase subunit 3 family protein [Bacillota bacterium]|nr:gluconate 2-dehydrogenase subunit 3 family protein [Bacillota bacterium]